MNYINAQKEIFNELVKGGTVGKFFIDENNVLVSPNGYMAYIFPISIVAFSLEKVREIKEVPIHGVIKPENEIFLTPDLRINGNSRQIYRRLKGSSKNVFVNTKFIRHFQNPKFYQEENKESAIVVTEYSRGNDIPVGIVLPIRTPWADNGYYNDDINQITK